MHAYFLLLFAIPALSWDYYQKKLGNCDGGIVHSKWDAEDSLNIVPLHKSARTGLVPPAIEEGLIAAAGPRFANVFIANITSDGKLGSCWDCVTEILKETPCLYNAVRDDNPGEILDCGVNKNDVCDCADCLPNTLREYVQDWCDNRAIQTEPRAKVSYVDFSYVGEFHPHIQGYRGDLKKYQLELIKGSGLAGAGPGRSVRPFEDCGCANVCVGLCIFGSCLGGCG